MILIEYETPLDYLIKLRDPDAKLWKIDGGTGTAESEDGDQADALGFWDLSRRTLEVILWPRGETLASAILRGNAQLWYGRRGKVGKTLKAMVEGAEELADKATKRVMRYALLGGALYLVGRNQEWW